jgi:hypothetical protein
MIFVLDIVVLVGGRDVFRVVVSQEETADVLDR